MKKLLIILLLILGMGILSSCEKDQHIEPNCNCGFITDDDLGHDINGNLWYSIDVRNDCSGNVKEFYLTQGDWMDANPGENFCYVSSW